MHLVYLDESGNTGDNLNDPDQPVFLLGALIVPEVCWQAVEHDLDAALAARFPDLAIAEAEIHAGDLRMNRGVFKDVPVPQRIALRDDWLGIAGHHGLKFVYRSIEKKRYRDWMHNAFGAGVTVNPHVAAFPLVAMVVNRYLASNKALGMFTSDENKQIVRDIEKSIRTLRLASGPLRLSQIIEKGFFIDSKKSRILQLCDLCALHARKKEEVGAGGLAKPFDKSGIELLEPLIHRGNEQIWDVIAWLKEQKAGGEK